MAIKSIMYFLPSRKRVIFAILAALFEIAATVVTPVAVMDMIDNPLMDAHMSILNYLPVLMILFIKLLISSFHYLMLSNLAAGLLKNLRLKIWEKILRLPIHFYDSSSNGETMSRITNDTVVIKDFFTTETFSIISGIVYLVIIGVIIFTIDWKISLLIFLSVPVTLILISFIAQQEYNISISIQRETEEFQNRINKVLYEIRTIKTSQAEKYESTQGQKIIKNLFHLSILENKIFAFIQPCANILLLFLFLVIFGYCSIRVSQGSLSAGQFLAIIFYLYELTGPVTIFGSFSAKLLKFMVSADRINQLLGEEEEPVISGELSEHLLASKDIDVQDLSFGYYDKRMILQSINFKIRKGSVTAIIGESGVGKTTFFLLLERFYQPSSGNICYGGVPIEDFALYEWRKKIAYVSQEAPLMQGTIHQNLTYGIDNCSNEELIQALSDVGLLEFIEGLPQGLHTNVGERGTNLSGGQRQRIVIARALIRNPEILLLDEATSHLDSTSEFLVQNSLNRLMKGRTTIIIAHRLSTIRNSDQIVIFKDGKISGIGYHEDLLENNSLYCSLVAKQEKSYNMP
ncbi:ABC transporter ATP-binding protein [Clostridium boliviensis]|uniref:ABC transporter ATP-binding protein n=1 Tax=Clostridium boliviensis TaxID=318465 RepID=A0ABU4GL16_9CLOT|nr:ABC transporter ATP-binding protein [Clostridium boliviensis]MDW2798305.1 ABC transporter ATP-binding protein [Clostridium boliviensis]